MVASGGPSPGARTACSRATYGGRSSEAARSSTWSPARPYAGYAQDVLVQQLAVMHAYIKVRGYAPAKPRAEARSCVHAPHRL